MALGGKNPKCALRTQWRAAVMRLLAELQGMIPRQFLRLRAVPGHEMLGSPASEAAENPVVPSNAKSPVSTAGSPGTSGPSLYANRSEGQDARRQPKPSPQIPASPPIPATRLAIYRIPRGRRWEGQAPQTPPPPFGSYGKTVTPERRSKWRWKGWGGRFAAARNIGRVNQWT